MLTDLVTFRVYDMVLKRRIKPLYCNNISASGKTKRNKNKHVVHFKQHTFPINYNSDILIKEPRIASYIEKKYCLPYLYLKEFQTCNDSLYTGPLL